MPKPDYLSRAIVTALSYSTALVGCRTESLCLVGLDFYIGTEENLESKVLTVATLVCESDELMGQCSSEKFLPAVEETYSETYN